jgi:hypothetical protein
MFVKTKCCIKIPLPSFRYKMNNKYLFWESTGNSSGVGGDITASEDSVSIGGTSAGGNGREGSITYGFGSDDSSSIGGLTASGVIGRRAQRESASSMRQSSSTSSLGAPLSVFPSESSSLRVSFSSRSSVSDCEEDDDSSGCSDWEIYRVVIYSNVEILLC